MALKDKLITLEDLKAVHDVDAEEITGIKADLEDLETTEIYVQDTSLVINTNLANGNEVSY